jgi:acetolactate synthase I/II/III large subunit
VDVPIVGDVKDVLTELIAMIRESSMRPTRRRWQAWWDTIEGWRSRDCLRTTAATPR